MGSMEFFMANLRHSLSRGRTEPTKTKYLGYFLYDVNVFSSITDNKEDTKVEDLEGDDMKE